MARKILFYTHAFGGGGAEIVFRRLADAFADAGDDVILVADHDGPFPVQDRAGLRHVLLGPHHLSATQKLTRMLRREAPDASFSALGAQNLKHVVAAFMAGRRNRCIIGYHGFAEAEPKRLSRLSFWATPLITRVAARTICVSDTLRTDLCERWHASRRRTVRIYNPVALSSQTAQPVSPNLDSPLILACGRLVPGKRFPDLVAAFADTEPKSARLAIVGEGPERTAIEAAVARHGLKDRVDLPGHVDDVSAWYARAACVAISSETESFGLTAAEALAHGTPVVSTDCGGPSEILQNGRYGRVVPVGDVSALAQALSETLASPGNANALRLRAQAFAMDAIHKAYADLIDALR